MSLGEKKAWLANLSCEGYTGRYIAKYIHNNNLASELRLVDKHLPELAWLAPEFKEVCTRERFVQADASRERACPQFPLGVHLGIAS
jgi:hypothetical protein